MSSEDKKYIKATVQAVLRGEDGQLLDIQWWDSEESDFSNTVEVIPVQIPPPDLYEDNSGRRVVDFSSHLQEELPWDFYRIRFYRKEGAGSKLLATLITIRENGVVDVTDSIAEEGEYIATLQGLVYADLTGAERSSLDATERRVDAIVSSLESDYSNSIFEEGLQISPPTLYQEHYRDIASLNDIHESELVWDYYRLNLFEVTGELPETGLLEDAELRYLSSVLTTKKQRSVDVTRQFKDNGIYVASIQGLLYKDLTDAERVELGATESNVGTLFSSGISGYSNPLDKELPTLSPPDLYRDGEDRRVIDFGHLSDELLWNYYDVRLFKKNEESYEELCSLTTNKDKCVIDVTKYIVDVGSYVANIRGLTFEDLTESQVELLEASAGEGEIPFSSKTSEYSNVHEELTDPLDCLNIPALYEKTDLSWWVDWSDNFEANLRWQYYRVKLFKVRYPEFEIPEGFDGEDISELIPDPEYEEVLSGITSDYKMNVTHAVLEVGEGEYVATVQGVIYEDLTEAEKTKLEEPEVDSVLRSGPETDYSNPLEEAYEQVEPPLLQDMSDKWEVFWMQQSFKWSYLQLRVYRANLPEDMLPKSPFDPAEITEEPEGDGGELPEEELEEDALVYEEVFASDFIQNIENEMPFDITKLVSSFEHPGSFYVTVRGVTIAEVEGERAIDDCERPSKESEPSNEISEELLQLAPPEIIVSQSNWKIAWNVSDVPNQEVILRLYHSREGDSLDAPEMEGGEEGVDATLLNLVREYRVANAEESAPVDVTDDVWRQGAGTYVATITGLGNRDLVDGKPSWQEEEYLHRDSRRTTVESLFSGEVEAVPQELGYDNAVLLTDYITSNHFDLIFCIEGIALIEQENMIGNVPRRLLFQVDRMNKAGEKVSTMLSSVSSHGMTYSNDQVNWKPAEMGALYSGGAIFLKVPIEAGAVDDFDLKLSIRSR